MGYTIPQKKKKKTNKQLLNLMSYISPFVPYLLIMSSNIFLEALYSLHFTIAYFMQRFISFPHDKLFVFLYYVFYLDDN